jgi:hypothetical protein
MLSEYQNPRNLLQTLIYQSLELRFSVAGTSNVVPVESGNVSMVKLLLDLGACPNLPLQDDDGVTIWDKYLSKPTKMCRVSYEVCCVMISSGADRWMRTEWDMKNPESPRDKDAIRDFELYFSQEQVAMLMSFYGLNEPEKKAIRIRRNFTPEMEKSDKRWWLLHIFDR